LKIALVDDEQICLDEISGLINEFGVQHSRHIDTVPFPDAETFLAAFASGGYDAVFMDSYMDGMDGVAAAMKMRGLDKNTPLVFLTSSENFIPDAFSLHAFEYVIKPAGSASLTEAGEKQMYIFLPNICFFPTGKKGSCLFTFFSFKNKINPEA